MIEGGPGAGLVGGGGLGAQSEAWSGPGRGRGESGKSGMSGYRADGNLPDVPGALSSAINCGDPGTPRNGTKGRVVGAFDYKGYVQYSCNKGFVLEGEAIITCEANQRWSDRVPVCRGTTVHHRLVRCFVNWPVPKRVGNWVGMSNAKALGIPRRGRTSKNAKQKYRTTTIVAVGAARCTATVLPRHFCCPCSNLIPPNDPKRHCSIDSNPDSRSFS